MQMKTAALQVDTEPSRCGVRVRVAGEIDCANAGVLRHALDAAIAGSAGLVELDLSGGVLPRRRRVQSAGACW
jgi:hypothetical protein